MQNDDEVKPTYGWLDPSGVLHGVEWGKHQEWAKAELKKLGITDAAHPGMSWSPPSPGRRCRVAG